jgi:hypothetical protein
MDKKVSVSQFLRAATRAPGARPRARPKAKAAPPPPRPGPAPAAPSGPPKDWRALAGGRPAPKWLLPAAMLSVPVAILSVLTIFGIVGAALPARQPPAPFVVELTAAERAAMSAAEARHNAATHPNTVGNMTCDEWVRFNEALPALNAMLAKSHTQEEAMINATRKALVACGR